MRCTLDKLKKESKARTSTVLIKIAILLLLPICFIFLCMVSVESLDTESKDKLLRVSKSLAVVCAAVTGLLVILFAWLLYLFIIDHAT